MQMSKAQILGALITLTFLHVVNVSALIGGTHNSSRRGALGLGLGLGLHIGHHHHRHKMLGVGREYLNAHNAFRQKSHVPPLRWNQKLAHYAYKWGMQRRNDCNWRHHSKGPFGENIMWEQYDEMDPKEVVNTWASEQINWDHQKNECKCRPERDGCMCSHYVTMVWKTTERVGCANVTCNDEKGIFIVCEYNPKGQWAGMNPLNPIK